MAPLGERFEMRLDEDLLQRLDEWRGRQPDVPSRSESARRLIDYGLGASGNSQGGEDVAIPNSDRLIISMLCDLLKAQNVRGEVDPDFIMSTILGGHFWALKMDSHLFHSHVDDREKFREVIDTLDMWTFVESAITKLTAKEKTTLKESRGLDKFIGYDGHSETEYMGIAHHLIHKMGRFGKFKSRSLDSHSPTSARYRRMARAFEPMRTELGYGRDLTFGEIQKLMTLS